MYEKSFSDFGYYGKISENSTFHEASFISRISL